MTWLGLRVVYCAADNALITLNYSEEWTLNFLNGCVSTVIKHTCVQE